ncbi:TetR family transcriptional regulator [Brevibacterium sp. 5221]|uniref:TetR family transcriptional regulator n=1 Tax=Brevibacterium rongguiense TaxID=2695267 RepID=A0A6N9H975_9MICO|nr:MULTISPECIES: TetR family transcriptional regulator [Brevibacterium]MYM20598.1 TetR family transcriptional regulator [Brevibacterium rongguiense]WAL39346.1 TetR family transcriptional regulator [Brevibacterium sp. BRM-1]
MRATNGREAILRAARDTFASKGFDGASIRDIAQAADLSLSALYYYFSSKQDALYELVSASYERFNAHSRQVIAAAGDDHAQRVAALVRYLVRFRIANPEISRVVLRDTERLTPDRFARLHELQKESRGLLLDIVRAGEAAGEFAVVDAALASRSILAICNAIPLWYRPGGDITPEDLERTYTLHALRILGCAEPGAGDLERLFAQPVPTGETRLSPDDPDGP